MLDRSAPFTYSIASIGEVVDLTTSAVSAGTAAAQALYMNSVTGQHYKVVDVLTGKCVYNSTTYASYWENFDGLQFPARMYRGGVDYYIDSVEALPHVSQFEIDYLEGGRPVRVSILTELGEFDGFEDITYPLHWGATGANGTQYPDENAESFIDNLGFGTSAAQAESIFAAYWNAPSTSSQPLVYQLV